MTQNERKTRTIQLESWEVGGELLDVLSRGLYSDAKDTLREYVQNGVDAGAEHILITVDGSQVVVRDDGTGMDDEGIRAARRFGMSDKSPQEMVGYRGIGIYSAFGICEEMSITSRREGMPHLVGWRFQFGEMRRLLESDKASDVRQGIGLPDLLREYTELFTEPYYGNVDDHFTVVELDGIDDEYRAQLNDAAEVNSYLLRTIPVAFESEGYGKAVNEWVAEHVGLNPVRISLRIADETEFDVLPPVATDVYRAETDRIKASDGTTLAFVWYALSTNGRQLPSYDGSSVSGFLLKIRGFTLGNRDLLKPLWPAVGGRTLYHHYTGEVHILETAQLFPNAARDDLESSPAKQQFSKLASDFFYPLSRKARTMQAQARAVRLLDGMDATIERLNALRDARDSNAFELYREAEDYRTGLENVYQEIRRHMRKPRGRPRTQFDSVQKASLDDVLQQLQQSIRQLGGVVKGAQRRTQKSGTRGQRRSTQLSPQALLLSKALEATVAMSEKSVDTRYKEAVAALRPLVRMRAIARAVGVLDNLKASGTELGTDLEASRKELRSAIGWSPLAPVSLEEALGQQGISLEEEEEKLIGAVDRGLVAGLGGRGEAYEAVLRAIADSFVEERGS